jgi:hypothetical protein
MKRNLIYLDVETLLEDIFELVSANKSNNVSHWKWPTYWVLDTENLWVSFNKSKIKTSLCLKFEKQLILTESN